MKRKRIIGYVLLSLCSLPFIVGGLILISEMEERRLAGLLFAVTLAAFTALGLALLQKGPDEV